MDDEYQIPYAKLFNTITDTINFLEATSNLLRSQVECLKTSQRIAEETYILAPEQEDNDL